MSQDMRRNGLGRQFRPAEGSRGNHPPHDMRRAEARQALAMCANKERLFLVRLEAPLAHKRPQRPGQIIGNRHNALFASFAAQEHLGSCPIEIKVADIDAECFGNTRAGAPEEKQQRRSRRPRAVR